MEAYQGYTQNGMIIPFDSLNIPDGKRATFTILDEDAPEETRAQRQKKALAKLQEELEHSEPLPPEFDEILSQRVNITRELDL